MASKWTKNDFFTPDSVNTEGESPSSVAPPAIPAPPDPAPVTGSPVGPAAGTSSSTVDATGQAGPGGPVPPIPGPSSGSAANRLALNDATRGMEAFHVLAPPGWTGQGEVNWGGQSFDAPALVQFTARTPSGAGRVGIISPCYFVDLQQRMAMIPEGQFQPDIGSPAMAYRRPDQFALWFLGLTGEPLTELSVTAVNNYSAEDRAEIDQELAQLREQANQMAQFSLAPMQCQIGAEAFTAELTGRDQGQPCVITVRAVVRWMDLVSQIFGFVDAKRNWGLPRGVVWTVAQPAAAAEVGAGAAMIRQSIAYNPAWEQLYLQQSKQLWTQHQQAQNRAQADMARQQQQQFQVQQQMIADQAAHGRRMSQMIQETGDYVLASQQSTFQHTADRMSAVSDGWTDAIVGRTNWQDPDGGVLKLDSRYDSVYDLGDGRLLATEGSLPDDSNLDQLRQLPNILPENP